VAQRDRLTRARRDGRTQSSAAASRGSRPATLPRVDDAMRREADEADARMLAELERDVQSALEGAREADRIVGR